jgi:hypothetical protein
VNSDDDGSVGSHQQRQRRQQEKHPKERDSIVPHPPNPRPVMRNGGAYAADPRPKGFAAHKAIDRNDKESKCPSPENLPQLGRGATSDDILEESFDDLDNVDLPPRAEKDTIDPPHRRVHNVPKSKIVSSVNPSLVINGGNGVSLADRAAERAAERAVERAERLGTLRGKLSNRQSMSNAGNIGSQPPHSVTGEGEGTVDNTGFGSTILATTLSFPTVDGATDD